MLAITEWALILGILALVAASIVTGVKARKAQRETRRVLDEIGARKRGEKQ